MKKTISYLLVLIFILGTIFPALRAEASETVNEELKGDEGEGIILSFERKVYAVAAGYSVEAILETENLDSPIAYINYSSTGYPISVDRQGVITGYEHLSEGDTFDGYVTASGTLEDGTFFSATCDVIVTDPFMEESYTIVKQDFYRLRELGSPSYSYCTNLTFSNPDAFKVTSEKTGRFKAMVTGGPYTISVTVDGKPLSTTVYITQPSINRYYPALTKGQTSRLKITGLSEEYSTEVIFASENESVATVSETGLIKAKKIGSTIVTATVDNHVFTVYVTVGTEIAVKAFKRAYAVLGATYSQWYRMKKGYYDCSSLAWRSYHAAGYNLCDSSNWAPTAAMEAKWLVKKGKKIKGKTTSITGLRVGDLIFFSYGKNGRYKNIDHVAMYMGNNLIIHANGTTDNVAITSYDDYKEHTVMVCRPTTA